jgi:hypothetical protein
LTRRDNRKFVKPWSAVYRISSSGTRASKGTKHKGHLRMHLGTSDLPFAFHVADKSSLRAQREMLRTTGLWLAALSLAALLGGLAYPVEALRMDVAGAGVAVCFAVAMAIEVSGMRRRPERTWYEGRAAAESLKTLAWQRSEVTHSRGPSARRMPRS